MKPSFDDCIVQTSCDLFKLASIYHGTKVKLEVERLFYLPSGAGSFIQGLGDVFTLVDVRTQKDEFWDDSERRLSRIDAYLRLRCEHQDDDFLKAEVKASYPGAVSNANVRPAVDADLDEDSLGMWYELFDRLNLSVERRYVKYRHTCKSVEEFNGYTVELEVDQFDQGGPLTGHSFVGFSVEVHGNDRKKAEIALEEAIRTGKRGTKLVDCGSANYETFFYNRESISRIAGEK